MHKLTVHSMTSSPYPLQIMIDDKPVNASSITYHAEVDEVPSASVSFPTLTHLETFIDDIEIACSPEQWKDILVIASSVLRKNQDAYDWLTEEIADIITYSGEVTTANLARIIVDFLANSIVGRLDGWVKAKSPHPSDGAVS